jgi:hypothetical protein
MSALIGVNNGDAIHILTDAASTSLNDGVVTGVTCKQVRTQSGAVVAAMGLWEPILHFSLLADERTQTFDELTATAAELWDEVRSALPARYSHVLHAALVAGWSQAEQRLQMLVLRSDVAEYDVFAAGPSESKACHHDMNAFIERFRDDPNAFDPRRDGVEFMQAMRQNHPRKYAVGPRAAVGGFVTHVVVTRDSLVANVIHEWPADRVGQLIDSEHIGSPMTGISGRVPGLLETLARRERIIRLRDGAVDLLRQARGQSAEGTSAPNQQQVDWVRKNPARRAPLFDVEFGNGAWSSYQTKT